MSTKKQEIPNIIFLVLHESGIIVYSYPNLGKEQYLLSSLISATMAIGEQISNREGEIASVTIGDRTVLAIRENDIIYALITTKHYAQMNKLLFLMIEETKKNFPAKIVDGIVRSKADTTLLDTRIESLITMHSKVLELEKRKPIETAEIPLTDVHRILGEYKFAKILRGLIADKNIIIMGYDPISIAKIIHTIIGLFPRPISFLTIEETELNRLNQVHPPAVIICRRGLEKKIVEKIGDTIILDFDKPIKKLKGDKLCDVLTQALRLEREESKVLMVKNELMSLISIVDDLRRILKSAGKEEITIDQLKTELYKKHPGEKVDYILRVLQEEKSHLIDSVKTPEKVLDEIFF